MLYAPCAQAQIDSLISPIRYYSTFHSSRAALTSTPTVTPTLTPSPTITPSPTPALPMVQGLIQLNFVPVSNKVIIPQPPYKLAITFKTGDKEIKVEASDTDGGFTTHMEPGKYTISSVTIQSEALGAKPLDIITDETEIEISSQTCQDLLIFE